MLGKSHAASGLMVIAATLPMVQPVVEAAGGTSNGMVDYLPFAAAGLGGAVLPDIDHPNGTIARSLGPVTKTLSHIANLVSGGHRQGTHSLVGAAVFSGITYGIGMWNPIAFGAWLAFLFAMGSGALNLKMTKGMRTHVAISVAVGGSLLAVAGTTQISVHAAVFGTAVGVLTHLLGDAITKQGIPLLWPFGGRVRLARLTTGEAWEDVARAIFFGATPIILGWWTVAGML